MPNTSELDQDTLRSMKSWARIVIAESLDLPPEKVSYDQDLSEIGVDSLVLTILASGFEDDFDVLIDPYWLVEYPSLNAFFENLPGLLETKASDGI